MKRRLNFKYAGLVVGFNLAIIFIMNFFPKERREKKEGKCDPQNGKCNQDSQSGYHF
jgi:hypothetical protein